LPFGTSRSGAGGVATRLVALSDIARIVATTSGVTALILILVLISPTSHTWLVLPRRSGIQVNDLSAKVLQVVEQFGVVFHESLSKLLYFVVLATLGRQISLGDLFGVGNREPLSHDRIGVHAAINRTVGRNALTLLSLTLLSKSLLSLLLTETLLATLLTLGLRLPWGRLAWRVGSRRRLLRKREARHRNQCQHRRERKL